MASGIYTNFKEGLMNGEFNLASDTINVALLTSSFVFSASDMVWSDVSSNEISGTGYTTGGQTLTSQATTVNGTTSVFTASNVSWPGSTFSLAFAVLYDITVSNDLICAFDFGGTIMVSATTFEIEWASSPVTGSIIGLS